MALVQDCTDYAITEKPYRKPSRMIKAHKIRLNPTAEQANYFARAAGTARFTFNWARAEWQKQYEAGGKPSALALRTQLMQSKRTSFLGSTMSPSVRWRVLSWMWQPPSRTSSRGAKLDGRPAIPSSRARNTRVHRSISPMINSPLAITGSMSQNWGE